MKIFKKFRVFWFLVAVVSHASCSSPSESQYRSEVYNELGNLLGLLSSHQGENGEWPITESGYWDADIICRRLGDNEAIKYAIDPTGKPYKVELLNGGIRGKSLGLNGVDEDGSGDDIIRYFTMK